MITHKLKYGVYHWDTFDNETILIEEFNSLQNAIDFISTRYKGRLSGNGADQVDIVDDKGSVVGHYKVS